MTDPACPDCGATEGRHRPSCPSLGPPGRIEGPALIVEWSQRRVTAIVTFEGEEAEAILNAAGNETPTFVKEAALGKAAKEAGELPPRPSPDRLDTLPPGGLGA